MARLRGDELRQTTLHIRGEYHHQLGGLWVFVLVSDIVEADATKKYT